MPLLPSTRPHGFVIIVFVSSYGKGSFDSREEAGRQGTRVDPCFGTLSVDVSWSNQGADASQLQEHVTASDGKIHASLATMFLMRNRAPDPHPFSLSAPGSPACSG
jgi:hypothetical protein